MKRKVLLILITIIVFIPLQLLNFVDTVTALSILLYLTRVYYIKFSYKDKKGLRIFNTNTDNLIVYLQFSKIKTLLLLGLSLVLVMHLPRLFLGNIITYLGGN